MLLPLPGMLPLLHVTSCHDATHKQSLTCILWTCNPRACRRQVKDPAHNPRARAPEHVQLVQSLGGTDHTQHAGETHLGTITDWDKLSVHLEHVAAPLTRCCFQCGMLNYPTPGDTIRVTNVGSRQECRAYRVFRYYIRELVKGERRRLRACSDAEATSEADRKAEAYRNVFLCKPTTDNAACKVYACSHCKRACRRRDAGGKLYYAQCSGDELDLFDGHTADGEYESNGIGEKQAPEYAACSVHDRLALSVLKMANATFKGYGGEILLNCDVLNSLDQYRMLRSPYRTLFKVLNGGLRGEAAKSDHEDAWKAAAQQLYDRHVAISAASGALPAFDVVWLDLDGEAPAPQS